jgi:hypothetical protein
VQFFADPGAAYSTKRNAKAWAKVQAQLEQLKSAGSGPVVVGSAAKMPDVPAAPR